MAQRLSATAQRREERRNRVMALAVGASDV